MACRKALTEGAPSSRPSSSRYIRHDTLNGMPGSVNGSMPSTSNVGDPRIPNCSAWPGSLNHPAIHLHIRAAGHHFAQARLDQRPVWAVRHRQHDQFQHQLPQSRRGRWRPLTGQGKNGSVLISIEASNLPGRVCGPSNDFPGYTNIHVGVQRRNRRDELLDLHPGDAPSASWALECAATVTSYGLDLTGPHIQGRPGARFIYLSWGTVDASGTFTMFRRAKLMLEAIPPKTLNAAVDAGHLLGRLPLTDTRGNPLCAAVRPPLITWTTPEP